jgi:hypothetical protein
MKAWTLQARGGVDIAGVVEASERYSTCQAGRPEDRFHRVRWTRLERRGRNDGDGDWSAGITYRVV